MTLPPIETLPPLISILALDPESSLPSASALGNALCGALSPPPPPDPLGAALLLQHLGHLSLAPGAPSLCLLTPLACLSPRERRRDGTFVWARGPFTVNTRWGGGGEAAACGRGLLPPLPWPAPTVPAAPAPAQAPHEKWPPNKFRAATGRREVRVHTDETSVCFVISGFASSRRTLPELSNPRRYRHPIA